MKDEGPDYVLDRIREGTLFGGGSVIEGSEGIEQMIEAIRDHVHPEFVTLMTSESADTEWLGVEGFREALTDWISPYETFRLEIEDAILQEDSRGRWRRRSTQPSRL